MSGIDYKRYEKDGISVSAVSFKDSSYTWSEGITILYVLKGQVHTDIHKDPEKLIRLILKSGQIYILGNKEIYRIYSDLENIVLLMHIDYERVSRLFKGAKYLEFDIAEETTSEREQEELNKLKDDTLELAQIIAEIRTADDFADHSNNFIKWLIDKFEIVSRKLAREEINPVYYERLLKCTDYIMDNFSNKDVLKQMSETQFLNSSYISRDLKVKIDYNYRQLISFYRVGHAIRLLLESDFNIAEISADCGFSATRYFYKEFGKFYSDGPTKFRKIYKNASEEFIQLDAAEEMWMFMTFQKSMTSEPHICIKYINAAETDIGPDIKKYVTQEQKCYVIDDGNVIGIAFIKHME